MKKSIFVLGVFVLFLAAPSFGQVQENTKATSSQENVKPAKLEKQEATPEKQRAKAELKTVKARKAKAIKPAQKLKKAEPINRDAQEAKREEN